MVGYDNDANALTLGDDDSLSVGDYELEYNSTDDSWQARYGRPIGGENGFHGNVKGCKYTRDSFRGEFALDAGQKENYVDVQHDGSLSGFTEFTVSAWVNLSNINQDEHNRIVSIWGGEQNSWQLFVWQSNDGGGVSFETYTVDYINRDSNNPAPTGEWIFVCGTYSANEQAVWLNDSKEDSTPGGGELPQTNSQLRIGADSGNNNFMKGLVDDVRIFDRELSESEISDLYNGTDIQDGLVAHYDFEYPETPDVAIDSTGDAFPKNSIPRNTTGSVVPQGLAESVSAGEALADDGNTYASVQAAVDAASGWVFVGPGTFNEAVTISTAGLTLEGCGEGTLIDGGTTGDAIRVEATDVGIKNLSVQTTSGEGENNDGIHIGASDCTVENVRCLQSDKFGIDVNFDDTIIDGYIGDGDVDSEHINVGGIRTIIRNCLMTLPSGVGQGHHCVQINQNNCIVSNCIIDGGYRNVFLNSSDNVVIGNRLMNAEDDALVTQGGGETIDNIIANNRISDFGGSGINDVGAGTVLDGNLTGASN